MKTKLFLWWSALAIVCLGVVVYTTTRYDSHLPATWPVAVASQRSQALPPVSHGAASIAPGATGAKPEPAAFVFAQGLPSTPVLDRAIMASNWKNLTQPELAAFAAWTDRYATALPADRPALAVQGVALAKERRGVMLDLIHQDPRQALASAVPLSVRKDLPTAVQDQLERRVSGEGELYRVAGLPTPDMQTVVPTSDTARVNGDYYEAHRYGQRAEPAYLRDASLYGVALDKQLAVSASPIRETEPGETPALTVGSECLVAGVTITAPKADEPALTSYQIGNKLDTTCCPYCTTHLSALESRLLNAEQAGVPLSEITSQPIMSLGDGGVTGSAGNTNKPPTSWTNGVKKLIFMRVDFSDLPYPSNNIDASTGNDLSSGSLTTQVTKSDGMNARIQRCSYGLTSIGTADVTPVMRMPKPTTSYWVSSDPGNCNNYWGPIQTDARAAATALGYNMNNYVCYIVVHPYFINNGAAAWGGGGQIWCNGYIDSKVLLHEYGHVFWLPHANSYTTTDGNILSSNRTHVEYGDAADPMGNAWGTGLNNEYNAYFKNFCNWLPDSSVQTITHPGTYRLYQNDDAATGNTPRVLKVSRNGSYDWWLAYRGSPISQSLYNQGVSILEVTPNTMSDTHVLDMNDPTGDTSNAPLSQGQVFSDTADGLTITNAGRGGYGTSQYIYVKVDFSSTHVTAPRPIVNGGIYRLRNKYYNQYLDVPNNSATAAVLLQLAASSTSDGQKWLARRNADGTYSFNHLNTDQWIDVTGNSGSNYATLGQYYSNGVDGQCWAAMPTSDGYVEFRHRNTNLVFCADRANNGNMIQYGEYGGDEQKWMPELVGITEGTYKIAPGNAPALVLDSANRGVASGGAVQTATPNGSKSQLWTVKYNGTSGQFRLINAATPTRSLGLSNGSSSGSGSTAVISDNVGSTDQLYIMTAVGSSWVRFSPVNAPPFALGVLNQSTAAGAGLVLGVASGTTSQQFQFLDADL